ncbi:YbaN family protein [Erythrobacter sp. W53]|uniref:YbaN family protein n=1 Tax=Erythrobacteraceae TaxID=335929 RepID=UPI0036D211BA
MRPLFLAGGIISVALGAIGAFLPIMPTVPFLLLAVFCFARSNPALEQKILDHPHWGPQVREWRERRAIPRRAKVMAVGAMSAGAVFTWFTLGVPWVYLSLAILCICGTWIATRNE